MSDNLGLGEILPPGKVAQRDAIHIAVVPMFVGDKRLSPGDHVQIMAGTTDHVVEHRTEYGGSGDPIGIVDPFLKLPEGRWNLEPGERIWVYMYPNTITGLRHDWTHPAFTNAIRENAYRPEAERWLRKFADKWNFDYSQLIEAATGEKREWAYVVARGIDLHSRDELGEDHDLFWKHIETMTGKTFDEEHRESMGWSCSC